MQKQTKLNSQFSVLNSLMYLRFILIWALVIVGNFTTANQNLPSVYAQDKIVAIVNNEIITQKDLNDFVHFLRMQLSREYEGEQLEDKIRSMKSDLLQRLIEDRLILQEAKKNDSKVEIRPNVTVSLKPEENRVKAKIDEIRKRYASETEFQNDLARQGLSLSDVENKIRDQVLMYNIIEFKIKQKITVRPDEVTSFYNQNEKQFFSSEERELDVVVLPGLDLANAICKNLKEGKNLSDLAAENNFKTSTIVARQQGELREDIEDVIFKMAAGEASDPIKVGDKYYVFRLNSITAPRKLALDEVKDKIKDFLFEKKMQEELNKWLNELKEKSYVKIVQD